MWRLSEAPSFYIILNGMMVQHAIMGTTKTCLIPVPEYNKMDIDHQRKGEERRIAQILASRWYNRITTWSCSSSSSSSCCLSLIMPSHIESPVPPAVSTPPRASVLLVGI
jgi:hypothetical protein